MENVRIYDMPACKMVVSPCGMFGDGTLDSFFEWFTKLPRTMFPRDYLWFNKEKGGFSWYLIYDETITVPDEFSIIDFPGGLYAVATDIDGQDDTPARNAIKDFINKTGCFEEDTSREMLGNVITSPSASEAMGYNQMDYYTPIRVITK